MEILRSRTTYLRITSNSSSFQMQQQKQYTSLKTYDREIRFVDVFLKTESGKVSVAEITSYLRPSTMTWFDII